MRWHIGTSKSKPAHDAVRERVKFAFFPTKVDDGKLVVWLEKYAVMQEYSHATYCDYHPHCYKPNTPFRCTCVSGMGYGWVDKKKLSMRKTKLPTAKLLKGK